MWYVAFSSLKQMDHTNCRVCVWSSCSYVLVECTSGLAFDVCSLGPEKGSGICGWSLNVLYLWLLYAAGEFRDNHWQMHWQHSFMHAQSDTVRGDIYCTNSQESSCCVLYCLYYKLLNLRKKAEQSVLNISDFICRDLKYTISDFTCNGLYRLRRVDG